MTDHEYQDPIPACCRECVHLDDDYDEMSGRLSWWCMLNVHFPTAKQTCARQNKYREPTGKEKSP